VKTYDQDSEYPTWLGVKPVEPPQASVNEALAYLVDQGVDVRLRTCQEYVKTTNENYPYRAGMFTLDADEYELLIDSGGYYLFLIMKDKDIIKGRLMPAQDVPYRRQLNWRDIFDA